MVRIVACLFFFLPLAAKAQEDLLLLLGPDEPTTEYTFATFKSTRVINMHSVENAASGALDFRVSHRFGAINTGAENFYGLDQALMRLGFEYGLGNRLMLGVGRSNVNKEIDGFFKYKLLRQSKGKKVMPISMSWFSSMVIRTTPWANPDRENYFSSRLYFCNQLLIARKFNEALSLQLAPTFVHRNLVSDSTEKNDVLAMGVGGRFKITKRTSFNAEYVYVLPDQLEPSDNLGTEAQQYRNSFSIGVDIETGGHVFQLHLTNSSPMNEKGFITETTGNWADGDIQFGFNVSRMFTVIRKRELPSD
jgi:hypothetical protein